MRVEKLADEPLSFEGSIERSAMTFRLSRRALVAALPMIAWSVHTRSARADATEAAPSLPGGAPVAAKTASRVVQVTSDAYGVTATLELERAPFPSPGFAYRDPTVYVFIPHHHRIARDGSVSMLVHFHGHNSTAERAMTAHQLREQLYDSKQNAILVVPEIAVLAPDSAAGKLESQGGLQAMLEDTLRTVAASQVRSATGLAAIPSGASIGKVCVSAHSGGYHAAACSLRFGGVPVHEVYLFDALYADVDAFKDWVLAARGKPMGARHKLVSYFTEGRTEANTRALFTDLARAGVVCMHEQVEGALSREELTQAEAISIRTRVAHGAVTAELNGLRDCLYASTLRRRLRTSWFDARTGARPLERRR